MRNGIKLVSVEKKDKDFCLYEVCHRVDLLLKRNFDVILQYLVKDRVCDVQS